MDSGKWGRYFCELPGAFECRHPK